MIVFNTIKIENFYSIKDVEFSFVTGLHKLAGKNGAGKSSIVAALSQCLYNKNPKSDGAIDSSYNYITNTAYCISVDLMKDGVPYTIINDRTKNDIYISKAGIEIKTKGIKSQLNEIQKIIGLDYPTFVSLTYLNQNSMSNVFDLSDSNNLVNKFFDISLLTSLAKRLKVVRRDERKHLLFLSGQEQDIKKTIATLEKYKEEDTTNLQRQKEEKEQHLSKLLTGTTQNKLTSLASVVKQLKDEMYELSEPLIKLKAEYNVYKTQAKQFSSGFCPVCNSSVEGMQSTLSKNLHTLAGKIREAEALYNVSKDKHYKASEKYTNLSTSYDSEVEVLRKGITLFANRITVIEEKNKSISKIREDIQLYEDKLYIASEAVTTKEQLLMFVEAALGVISSGSVTKQYVSTFIQVFNTKIAGLSATLDLPLEVKVLEDKGSILYEVSSKGEIIPFINLSSGERTRVALLTLLGIVATLEVLTNVQLNILIFDELLSVLDPEGVTIFKDQLNTYRDTKTVLVIIHHDEIEDSYFDDVIKVTKQDGLTRITL